MSFVSEGIRSTVMPGKRRGSLACLLVTCGLALLPVIGHAQLNPISVTGIGQDDFDTATLNPNPPVAIFNSNWITNSLAASGFTAANGWNFNFAGAAASAFVQPDLTINKNFAWVVNSPNVTAPDGTVYNRGVVQKDAGGAVFQLTYTPAAGDPVNIHFLQAYNESFNGGAFTTHLDNGGAVSPFYDALGASGLATLAGNGSWLLDIPYDSETGPEGPGEIDPYTTDVQFETMIAVDNVGAGGVHNVTIYGGDRWGYKFAAADTPEPSTCAFLGAGALGAGGFLRRRYLRRRPLARR